jgi:DNA-directed RNA polymerase specialized sigma subunit
MHYEVLFSYYVEGLTFEKIAAKIDYSFRQILRLHGQALVAFEKKYGHTYQKK